MTPVKDVSTNEFNEITSSYLEEFQDKETRHIYVDEFLNAKIATQIKVLREQRGWTQKELAEKTGMKQERISVLEDVNYSAWTLNILRRLAEAFDLRINLTFEDFGSFLDEFAGFSRESLERTSFDDDPAFSTNKSECDFHTGYNLAFYDWLKPNDYPTLHLVANNSEENLPLQLGFPFQKGEMRVVKVIGVEINNSEFLSENSYGELLDEDIYDVGAETPYNYLPKVSNG